VIAGIICEYNPFHRGHAAMLEKVRKAGADTVVCAMSGNFVQRGETAVLSKFARAEMALRGGADLVLELPTLWAMATAETFARGGVEILSAAWCDTLAFGSECADAAAIDTVAQTLLSDAFPEALKEKLSSGVTFAVARQRAAQALCGDAAGNLSRPNDILAVEYAKAIYRQNAPMELLPVQRIGIDHDAQSAGTFASASYVRELLQQGELIHACDYIPDYSAEIIQKEIENGRICDPTRLNTAILSRLRRLSEEDFARCDGGGEGLYHRLYDAVRSASTIDELMELAKTKRYPMARLRRMVMCAWLDMPQASAHVPYLRVLGADEKGRALLRRLQKEGKPILTKPADVAVLGSEAMALFSAESAWTDQFLLGMAAPQKPGADWRYTPLMK